VLQRIARLSIKSLVEGKDEHFNNIPLQTWDRMLTPVPFEISKKLKELGDYATPAGVVCILKEAAMQIVETKLVRQSLPVDLSTTNL
jgi:hypothetical protein